MPWVELPRARRPMDFKTPKIWKTVEVYDPTSNTWSMLDAKLNKEREGLGIAVLNNKIYAVGGFNGRDGSTIILNTVEVYDPDLNSWSISKVGSLNNI